MLGINHQYFLYHLDIQILLSNLFEKRLIRFYKKKN